MREGKLYSSNNFEPKADEDNFDEKNQNAN